LLENAVTGIRRRTKQGRGWHQHFLGFRPRLNWEYIPVIPAWIVRANFEDPRKIPYPVIRLIGTWDVRRQVREADYPPIPKLK